MKKKSIILILLGTLLLLWVTQLTWNMQSTQLDFNQIPEDFTYDWCSMIPDWDLLDCCIVHDQWYFFGGSWKERIEIDNSFNMCILEKWHWYSPILAPIMWSWVRLWWAPIWPTPFRWWFGRDLYE